MTIEITEFANVDIAVSPAGASNGNFGILGFLTKASDLVINPISPVERARPYKSLSSVAGDWAVNSEVYKAATAFYGQTPSPTDFTVIMNYDSAQKAQVVGGTHDTIEELNSITAGTLDITIDGTNFVDNAVNLAGDATLDAVAVSLTTLIGLTVAGATVTYGAFGFVVTGVTAGISGTITFGTGDVAIALGIDQANGKAADGVDIETPVASLTATVLNGNDFVGLVTHKDFRDNIAGAAGESTIDIANWAEGAKKIFCNTSNSLSVLNSTITSDVFSATKLASLRFTLNTFSKSIDLYPSASVFGRAASVNFAAVGSTITLNLKQMPGITAEDLTPAEFQALRDKNGSAVVKIGSSLNAYTDSRMASGSWLDTTHGLLWLENRCEVDMFNLLYQSNTKVPFTQTGINITAAVLDRSLAAAVRNGLAGPGFLPDGTYLPEGYLITSVALADVPSADKGNRLYAGHSFVMVGAGALHEVAVSGNFSE